MKKIIFIISFILLILFVFGFVVSKYIFSKIDYFSKTLESSINLSLGNLKTKSEKYTLKYADFKCSGERSIECNSKHILYDKGRYNIEVNDINFILTPYYKNADFSLKAKATLNVFVDESFKSLPVNIECFGNMDLMPEKTYIKTDYWCNAYINYLKSFTKSTVYFKNKEFNEKNIYEFAKKFDSFVLNEKYLQKISSTSFAFEYLKGYIKSKDLYQEYINIVRRFDVNYVYEKETAMISVENFNAELFFIKSLTGKDSFEYIVFKKITDNIKNIVLKNHNRLSYNITIKGGKKLDKLFMGTFQEAVKIIYTDRSYHLDMETSPK